jgi:hypothetical protein
MNPNLIEQFLGPSTQFFCFNTNDYTSLVSANEKKTSLLTKRNRLKTKVVPQKPTPSSKPVALVDEDCEADPTNIQTRFDHEFQSKFLFDLCLGKIK